MRLTRRIIWISILLLLTACGPASVNGTPQPGFSLFPSPTPLRTPPVGITHVPDAESAMTIYLEALKNGDYAAMYALLSKATQNSISQADFGKKYDDALNTMSASKLDYQLLSEQLNPTSAQVNFQITYHTALVGDIQRTIIAHLVLEQGKWRIQWDPTLILPELTGSDQLAMDYQIPSRGNIYDQNGAPIAQQSDAYAIGVIPGQLGKAAGSVDVELSRLMGIPPDAVHSLYANAVPDSYVGITEATADEMQKAQLDLSLTGLETTKYTSRFYFDQGIAPQVVGYTQLISPDQLNTYRRLGYQGTELIGQTGIEKSMESYLAGRHGGTLYVVDANGQLVSKIGATEPQPADSVYLTIDENLQHYAQQALTGYDGAIVVMELNTGRVLAMASSPEYDQNLFTASNANSSYLLNDLSNRVDQPLVNRATQGQYPLGSVFKIPAMAAALESGLYAPNTTYDCEYHFTELNGIVLNDWTWDFCQQRLQTGKACDTVSTKPSGLITLQQGLMRSCDPYFWHISVDLFNHDRAADITNMARAFGLGSPTGIGTVAEASGNISVPTTLIQATNQVIGQGDVQVTPIQVARFVAAIGNGGTLYTPQLIQEIQSADGKPVSLFKPEAAGTLPIQPDRLAAIQQAMQWVISDPRGTAYYAMLGLTVPMGGKTGTAQTGAPQPDAWFVGYTQDQQNSGKPDIAVVVIMENSGEGADYAAPVFRWMIETYYYGQPQTIPPILGPIGNPYTPTPLGGIPTKTPKPTKTPRP
ncbi:MAG TPA: penicillin-binding transpeptidase domain-containing protein [Anaerolineales bacterium]|nr:penicillin-binding transpeptidase domain-containing protein [Anaerolineales bacterium]